MIKLEPLQSYFTFFYIFGLNSFMRFDQPLAKRSLIVLYLPRVIYICINLIIAYQFLKEKFNTFSIVTPKFNLIILVFSNFLAIFENMCKSHTSRAILQNVQHILDYLEFSFKIEYPFKKIKREFYRNALLAMSIAFAGLLTNIFITSDIGITKTSCFLVVVMVIYRNIKVLHIVLYIDFVRFSLSCLNEKISYLKCRKFLTKRRMGVLVGRKSDHCAIRQMKFIHMKLWYVSCHVNSFFGWVLIDHLVGTTISLTYSTYWVFLYSTRPEGDPINIIRNYINMILTFEL